MPKLLSIGFKYLLKNLISYRKGIGHGADVLGVEAGFVLRRLFGFVEQRHDPRYGEGQRDGEQGGVAVGETH